MSEPVDRLTWAALLGRWVEFARDALAWPDEGDGRKLRASVADLIMLQAVTFALEHLQELDPSEHALGLDRAEVLIDKHAAALRSRWGDDLPQQMELLIRDARALLDRFQSGGGSHEFG